MEAHPYVNGKFLKGEINRETTNPATLETVTKYSIVTKEDIENSLNSSQEAFEKWSRLQN